MQKKSFIFKQVLSVTVTLVLGASFAQAQRSKRVFAKDEASSASTTPDSYAKANRTANAVTAATGVIDTRESGTLGAAAYVPTVAPTPAPKAPDMSGMISGIAGALGSLNSASKGSGANGNKDASTNSGAETLENSDDGLSPPNSSPVQNNNPRRNFAASAANGAETAGDNVPLPASTQIKGCSASTTTWQPPTVNEFRLTSCFGQRRSTHSNHGGLDIVITDTAKGRPVTPAAPGKIQFAGWKGGYGCAIIIEHNNCPAAMKGETGCTTLYGHLKKVGGKCPQQGNTGNSVTPCNEIAQMGNTGGSQGPHLHFEIRRGSERISPITNFREWQAHENYDAASSTCGTVGGGKAPIHQTPASSGQNSGGTQ